jgi:hypothetical protein
MLTHGQIKAALDEAFGKKVEKMKSAKTTSADWVWVEGYKGTDANMCCNDYQYELNVQHDMPDDSTIEVCRGGFHFCQKLSKVFQYYAIGDNNRFFKVRALVKKSDIDDYDKAQRSPSLYFGYWMYGDKFAAKSIIFERELTVDEILKECGEDTSDWTSDEKTLAIREGIPKVKEKRRIEQNKRNAQTLVSLGYSDAFAAYICNEGWFKTAYAVGTQSDLSMDMKVLTILREHFDD